MTCKRCDGKGMVWVEYSCLPYGRVFQVEETCPVCHGAGQVNVEPEKQGALL